jgi:hypothetical protein
MYTLKPESLDDRIHAANLISRSLLYSLSRQHLDVPLADAQFIQPLPPPDRLLLEEPCFLRIDRIGGSVSGSFENALTALQTTLSACHAPKKYTLIFLVTSNGHENHIYLGIRSHNYSQYPSVDFIENIGNFLQGNWPGTKVSVCTEEDPIFAKEVLQPLRSELRNAIALTGIPSLKDSDHSGYPQTLDRFLRGFQELPFTYMVIAEPMGTEKVEDILLRCRELLSHVYALTKITQTLTTTEGSSQSQGWTASKSQGKSTGTTSSEEATRPGGADYNRDLLKGLGLAALGTTKKFSPLGFAAALGAILTRNKSSYPDRRITNSITETNSETMAFGLSETSTLNQSATEALGQEYINAHAQTAEKQLQQFIDRFEKSFSLGCWNVGVYLLANRPDIAKQGGTQLKALLTGKNTTFEPIRVHDLTRLWAKSVRGALQDFQQPCIGLVQTTDRYQKEKFTLADRIEHPLGPSFSHLTTPLNTEELALLVNLPRKEVPGVKVMPTATFSLNPPSVKSESIKLGSLLEGGEPTSLNYKVSLDSLAKHTLVTGITGSGKTTTCKNILNELTQNKIPFLIIEPAKEEYVEWAMQFNESLPEDSPNRISIYIPGLDSWRGTRLKNKLVLNPFDFVWLSEEMNPQVLSHIDRLKSILNGVFPMQEILPILLEDSLYHAYSRPRDWIAEQLPPFDTPRPTLTQLVDQIQTVVKGKGYEPRIAGNLTAALTTRIQSLRRGWKKQLFDQPRSTPWQNIFDRPTVVNLSHLGDDSDKAFTMALLFQFLYEYRQAQFDQIASQKHPGNNLRHLTIIEEAHRILLNTNSAMGEQANPQGKVAEMFANILSEIRAYGQGFLLVDQIPARLIPDAVKNTNLKIVHRLVAADDRDAMSACMTLTPEQTAIISRLRAGQAIVCGELDDMAAWVKIASA